MPSTPESKAILKSAVAEFYNGSSLPFKERDRLGHLSAVQLVVPDEDTLRTAAAIAMILVYCDVQPDGTFIRGSGRILDGRTGHAGESVSVGPESGVLSQLLSPGLHRCSYISGQLHGVGAEDAVYKLDFEACRECMVSHNGAGKFTRPLERLEELEIQRPAQLDAEQEAERLQELEIQQSAQQEVERLKRLGEQARRPDQKRFSATIRRHYRQKCAVTGCNTPAALQAAHIRVLDDHDDNSPTNGILLRADIHALFDALLITLTEDGTAVEISRALTDPTYVFLDGATVLQPKKEGARPSQANIRDHRNRFHEKETPR